MADPDPRCTCTHERSWHYDRGTGRCDADGCLCSKYTRQTRKPEKPWW